MRTYYMLQLIIGRVTWGGFIWSDGILTASPETLYHKIYLYTVSAEEEGTVSLMKGFYFDLLTIARLM